MSDGAVDVIDLFLVADNRLFREALAKVIGKKSDLRVVGASAFDDSLLQNIAELKPHVVLWDPTNGDPDLQFVRGLHSAIPSTKLVMVGMDDDPGLFLRCVRAGIVGYILKDAPAIEVAVGIRTVAYGGAVCSPTLCCHLFNYYSSQSEQSFAHRNAADLGLSRREHQLVGMVGRGLTNKEIASALNLSEQTIKNHIHRVLRKLGTTDRLAAFEICQNHGLFV